MINPIRRLLNRFGFDMVHHSPLLPLLRAHQITTILDVGAHEGESERMFRAAGFEGQIVRFEAQDAGSFALSDHDGLADFYVTGNSGSCGLLEPLGVPTCEVATREITVRRLDSVWQRWQGNIMLKVDAEGADIDVVRGASLMFDRIPLIMIEVAMRRRYRDERLMPETVAIMDALGYRPVRIHKTHPDKQRGIDREVDVVFERMSA